MKKRIGILTGGGDCPGLNAVIRAVVWRAASFGDNIIGLKNGWAGLLTGEAVALDRASVAGLLYRGGTILGTSRTNLFKDPQSANKAIANIKKMGLDAIIAVGGEDTLGAAARLSQRKVPIVGVPKTIDNDLPCTDFTFGFDTAISIATEAIDRLHTTAESHNRVLVVEVMGRHAGWIAAYAGLAGGADIILVPEYPFTVEEVCEAIRRRHDAGKFFSIVCVAEGAQMMTKKGKEVILASKTKDAFGHVRLGGIGAVLSEKIEAVTGYETRVTVLGHIQRGGSPTAHDRVLATRYGIEAMDCVNEGDFGNMVALCGTDIVRVPLRNITKKIKTINRDFYELTKVFQY